MHSSRRFERATMQEHSAAQSPSAARNPREGFSRTQELLSRSRNAQLLASPNARSSTNSPFAPSTPSSVRETLQRSAELGKRAHLRHQSRGSFEGQLGREGALIERHARAQGDGKDGEEEEKEHDADNELEEEVEEDEEESLLAITAPLQSMHLNPFQIAPDKRAQFAEMSDDKQRTPIIAGYDDMVEANRKQYQMLVDGKHAEEDGMRPQENTAMLMMLLRQQYRDNCLSRAQMPAVVDRLLRETAQLRMREETRQQWQALNQNRLSIPSDESVRTSNDTLLDDKGVFRIPGLPRTNVLSHSAPGLEVGIADTVDSEEVVEDEILQGAIHCSSKPASMAQLVICIGKVSFWQHPLMSDEDRLALQLHQMFVEYREVLESQVFEFLAFRIAAFCDTLRGVLERHPDNISPEARVARQCWQAVVNDLGLLYQTRRSFNELTEQMRQTWKQLQSLRSEQRYTSTELHMESRKIMSEQDRVLAQESFERVLANIPQLVERLTQQWETICGDDTKNAPDPDWQHAQATMTKYRDFLLSAGIEEKEVLRCESRPNQVTADVSCQSMGERRRRENVRTAQVQARVMVNDHELAVLPWEAIRWPSFNVDFLQKVFVRLAGGRHPSISVQLWTRQVPRSRTTKLCSFIVPIPEFSTPLAAGIANNPVDVQSILPAFGWCQFAAEDGSGSAFKRVAGAALAGTTWQVDDTSQEHSQHVILPIAPIQSNPFDEAVSSTTQPRGLEYDFLRDRDFHRLLPRAESLDRNHPDNQHLLELLDSMTESQQENDLFRLQNHDSSLLFQEPRGTFGNHTKFEETYRMRLLKTRHIKPFVFKEPIPFDESDIKHSDNLRSLLATTDAQSDTGERAVLHPEIYNFVARVQASQLALRRRARKAPLRTSQVVQEQAPMLLAGFTLGEALAAISRIIPERRRPLRPNPRPRQPTNALINQCALLVQLVGGRNIPLRSQPDKFMVHDERRRRAPHVEQDFHTAATTTTAQYGETKHELDPEKLQDRTGVSAFVELQFQSRSARTTTSEGSGAYWKETISVPFDAPNGIFSPQALMQMNDMVSITVFDEVEIDDAAKGGFREGESTVRQEKRYLGTVAIPFTTVYMEGKIEGQFKLNVPCLHLGYQSRMKDKPRKQSATPKDVTKKSWWTWLWGEPQNVSTRSSETVELLGRHEPADEHSAYEFAGCESRARTFVKIMATLDPLLTPPEITPEDESLHGDQHSVIEPDRPYVVRVHNWKHELAGLNQCRQREFPVFATRSNGAKNLVCRFLTPQRPPKGFTTRRRCAHFVSLIPYLDDWKAFTGDFDLWCSSQPLKEFLDILAGDVEEHAILLYNYFLFLEANEANRREIAEDIGVELGLYLVFGRAFPEGSAMYVMRDIRRRERRNRSFATEDMVFYCPNSGEAFSAADPNCPLVTIHCLATPNNMFANIQQTASPREIAWDVRTRDHWKPLFDRNTFDPTARHEQYDGIQNAILSYPPTDFGFANEIEQTISKELKNAFRKWRRNYSAGTTFQPDVSTALETILPYLEQWKLDGGPVRDPAASMHGVKLEGNIDWIHDLLMQRLANFSRTRAIRGFPLNMPFCDIATAIQQVKSTAIHEVGHRDVQFGMAVKAFPYTNNLVSVWVFIVVIEPLS